MITIPEDDRALLDSAALRLAEATRGPAGNWEWVPISLPRDEAQALMRLFADLFGGKNREGVAHDEQ